MGIKLSKESMNGILLGVGVTVIWFIHIVFIGWWSYFTSKETHVLNNADDIASMKRTTHNRHVNNAIDELVLRHSKRGSSGCDNPITVVHRDHAYYLTDTWTISDEHIKITITGSRMTMTIYPL